METRQQPVYTNAPADVPRDRKAASDEDALPWSDFAVLVWSRSQRPLDARGTR